MNPENPEIILKKQYSKPQLKSHEVSDEDMSKIFESADCDIRKFPDLLTRARELKSMKKAPFEDAEMMAQIIEYLYPYLEKTGYIKTSKNELKLACLFHDIGKSGPLNAVREERFLIEQIFNPIYFNTRSGKFFNHPKFKDIPEDKRGEVIKNLTINEVLEIENPKNIRQIKEYLSKIKITFYKKNQAGKIIKKEEKLDLDKHTMIQLWREHDNWTYQLLEQYQGEDQDHISKKLIIIASLHHTLEGNYPIEIDKELLGETTLMEVIDKYLIVTLVDKYQAFIDRSGMDHKKTIAAIREKVNENTSIDENIKVIFLEYLDVLEKHPEIADMIK